MLVIFQQGYIGHAQLGVGGVCIGDIDLFIGHGGVL